MPELLRNRWPILIGGYLLVAVIGAAVAMAATGGFGTGANAGDRLAVVYSGDAGEPEGFPVTTHAAISAGWQETPLCTLGRGRFTKKQTEDNPSPLMLVYDHEDKLIALNLYSPIEQPSPPWQYLPDGIATGIQGRESEHWGLSIYLSTPLKACASHIRATFARND